MNVTKQELLSALWDDEAGDFERRRLLDELKQDEALVGVWQRYALAGEVLRNNPTVLNKKRDFLAGIHAALEEDEVATPVIVKAPVVAELPPPKVATPLWRVVMQYGAAASIGAVIAAGFVLNRVEEAPTANLATNPPVIQPVAFNATTPTPPVKTARPISRLDPKTQALLRSYIEDHIRYASTTSVVPTVRAVSYNQ
ncbi:sigma-E factor negative regulatory protein [Thiofilum flexile]|uniref:sigma-E factor negative regulatory protein n=1 Tax=Thiofilum flexile TaxID=125627 RepID=UPI00036BB430|nr:sigma-E factor negative regulatory protein [Thiofilum flexile]